MSELNKALADILEIRTRIAAGTAFHGFGPIAMSVTALIGAATAGISCFLVPDANPPLFTGIWIAAGLLCAIVVRIEMQGRSQRHHSSLATAMINQAIEQFLPAATASIFLPLFILQFSPSSTWMLPGLWQVLVSLGIFASLRSLPRGMMLAGGWYFLSGFVCLLIASKTQTLSPWLMGVPFFAGQMLIAAVLYYSAREDNGKA
jgi:hypothetical protein